MGEFIKIYGDTTAREIVSWVVAIAFIIGVAYKYGGKIVSCISKLNKKKRERELCAKQVIANKDAIEGIKISLATLEDTMTNWAEDAREYRNTSLGDKIFKKYVSYTERGNVTKEELDNFNICVTRYKKTVPSKHLADDLTLNKYAKTVFNLKIRE